MTSLKEITNTSAQDRTRLRKSQPQQLKINKPIEVTTTIAQVFIAKGSYNHNYNCPSIHCQRGLQTRLQISTSPKTKGVTTETAKYRNRLREL